MKVLLFFLYAFGFMIGLPALLMGTARLLKQPNYLLKRDLLTIRDGAFEQAQAALGAETVVPPTDVRAAYPMAEAAVMGIFRDSTRTMLIKTADKKQRIEAQKFYLAQSSAGKSSGDEESGWRFKANGTESTLMIPAADDLLLIIAGPDDAAVDARRATTPMMAANPKRTIGNKMDGEWKGYVLAAILAWAAINAGIFCRLASWAGSSSRQAGVASVDPATLRQRLLAINDQDVPFTISPGETPEWLIVDWKYADAKWFNLLRAGGTKRLHRLVLRLDDAQHRVSVMDYESQLDWSAGPGPENVASLSWSGQKGITFFDYQHVTIVGAQIRDGKLTGDLSYTYTFNLAEMKRPILEVVTQSGWDWRPVMTWWKPLSG